MNTEEIIDSLKKWLKNTINDGEIHQSFDGFYTEQYEHGFFIRYGSKRGTFPYFSNSPAIDKFYIANSGEKIGENIFIDENSRTEISHDALKDIATIYLTKIALPKYSPSGRGFFYELINNETKDEFKISVTRRKPVQILTSTPPNKTGAVIKAITPSQCPWLDEEIPTNTKVTLYDESNFFKMDDSNINIIIDNIMYEVPSTSIKWDENNV